MSGEQRPRVWAMRHPGESWFTSYGPGTFAEALFNATDDPQRWKSKNGDAGCELVEFAPVAEAAEEIARLKADLKRLADAAHELTKWDWHNLLDDNHAASQSVINDTNALAAIVAAVRGGT